MAEPKESNGPRALDRLPEFRPPAGAWDCHCHVFGPRDRFPLSPGRSYTPQDVPAERLMDLHDRIGFGNAVLVQAAAHGTDHAAMLDAMFRSGGRYRGVMLVDGDGAEVDFGALHAKGMRGVRFNLIGGEPVDMAPVERLAERLAASGGLWHLELHGTPRTLGALGDWADLGLPVVVDHCARPDLTDPDFQAQLDTLVETLANPVFWMKVSGVDRVSHEGAPFADAIPVARALMDSTPDRCLWGTDFPHPNHSLPPHDADVVDAIPAIAPTPEAQDRLLIGNPARLFEGVFA